MGFTDILYFPFRLVFGIIGFFFSHYLLTFFLIIAIAVFLFVRSLFRRPRGVKNVITYHHFSPNDYAMNKLDALMVQFFGKSRFVAVSEEQLIKRALQEVPGNVGFGKNDYWKKPFGHIVNMIRTSKSLSVTGRKRLEAVLLKHLKVRLEVEMVKEQKQEELKAYDNIDEYIVCVSGLPRSGATVVHNLLALDPDLVSFDLGDVVNPARPRDENKEETEKQLKFYHKYLPELKKKHAMESEKKEDDSFLMRHCFMDPLLALSVSDGSQQYRDYLLGEKNAEDMKQAYEDLKVYYKLILMHKKVALKDKKRKLIVKSPFHLTWHKAYLQVFPNAHFVVLHRNPKIAISSFCSILETVAGSYDAFTRFQRIGQEVAKPRLLSQYVDTMKGEQLDFKGTDGAYLNIQYKWLMIEAISMVVKKVYAKYGWFLEDSVSRKMKEHLRRFPPDLHGKHEYSLDKFHLDVKSISRDWETYYDMNPDF